MRDHRLKLEEELLIFGIIPRDLYVRACELFDRLSGLPERDQEKMRLVPLKPSQDIYASIPLRRLQVRNSGFVQVVEVRVGLCCCSDAVPNSCDHEALLHAGDD